MAIKYVLYYNASSKNLFIWIGRNAKGLSAVLWLSGGGGIFVVALCCSSCEVPTSRTLPDGEQLGESRLPLLETLDFLFLSCPLQIVKIFVDQTGIRSICGGDYCSILPAFDSFFLSASLGGLWVGVKQNLLQGLCES